GLQPLRVEQKVAPVGLERVLRQAVLEPEGLAEGLDELRGVVARALHGDQSERAPAAASVAPPCPPPSRGGRPSSPWRRSTSIGWAPTKARSSASRNSRPGMTSPTAMPLNETRVLPSARSSVSRSPF